MAMSGVRLAEGCTMAWNDIQKNKKHRYVTFMIKNDEEIVVDKIGARSNTYDDFKNDIQQKDGKCDDCRYGLYDYEYSVNTYGEESITRAKTFLMNWSPDSAKVKKKMLYSASFESVKKAFVGVGKIIQANGIDDLEQSTVEENLRATDRH